MASRNKDVWKSTGIFGHHCRADILLAPLPGSSVMAGTTVTCHLVPAGPPVETGRGGAVVDVGLAEFASHATYNGPSLLADLAWALSVVKMQTPGSQG